MPNWLGGLVILLILMLIVVSGVALFVSDNPANWAIALSIYLFSFVYMDK